MIEEEIEANETRDRLMRTVEELDRRRHELTNVRLQLRKHLVLAGAVVVVTLGGLLFVTLRRVFATPEQKRHARWLALRRAWDHPERVGRRRPPMFVRTIASIVVGAIAAFVVVRARRAMKEHTSARLPLPYESQIRVRDLGDGPPPG